jgi:hypothetical protein
MITSPKNLAQLRAALALDGSKHKFFHIHNRQSVPFLQAEHPERYVTCSLPVFLIFIEI